jgi:hypothetical protein
MKQTKERMQKAEAKKVTGSGNGRDAKRSAACSEVSARTWNFLEGQSTTSSSSCLALIDIFLLYKPAQL